MKQALLIILILFSLNFTTSYRDITTIRKVRTIAYVINTESDKATFQLILKKREFIVINYIILLSSIRTVDFLTAFHNTS